MSAPRTAVVVGVDGSDAASAAALWAADEAHRRHAWLHIVTAYSVLPPLYPAAGFVGMDFGDELQQAALEVLTDAEARVRTQHPDLVIRTSAVSGHPVRVVVDGSRSAVLTVLGSRGRGQLTGVLLGSTASRVAPRAHSPLVVIRPGTGVTIPPTEGPVLLGVDGSPDAQAAIGFAFDEAALRRTWLLAVHTWATDPLLVDRAVVLRPADRGRAAADERRVLSEQLAGWSDKYPDVKVIEEVIEGNAAAVLVDRSIRGHRPQLAVVGSRGRGGFRGMLLGSVSSTLLTQAGCPVAVVRDETS